MKRLSLYVFAIALTLGIAASLLTGVAARGTQSATSRIYQATNAAFRDGLYVGKLDAAQGNRPHVGSGRWGADKVAVPMSPAIRGDTTRFFSPAPAR